MNPPLRLGLVVVASVISVLCVAALHYETGVAYEFELFFLIPVVAVAWVGGTRPAIGLALVTTVIWLAVDRALLLEQAMNAPALFNFLTRFSIFTMFVLAVGKIRALIAHQVVLARTDGLTGLLNRRGFHEEAERLLAFSARHGLPVAALFMDVDGFKGINDRLGHEVGDQVLVKVASVLTRHARKVDVLSRPGGDEFVVLLSDIQADDALNYAGTLNEALLSEMQAHQWPATFSIGIASATDASALSVGELLASADQLMYQAKSAGKNSIRLVRL